MFKNYFKTPCRSLKKNKGYSAINIGTDCSVSVVRIVTTIRAWS